MTDNNIHLLCAWGGTGGHVFPMIALLEYIDDNFDSYNQISSIHRAGNPNGLEKNILDQQSFKHVKVWFLPLSSGKLRRQKTLKALLYNITDSFKLGRGILQAIYYCKKHKINVIFSKGGYIALPVMIAAKLLTIKTIIHESDSKLGMTSRFASNFAQSIFSAYPDVHPDAKLVTQLLTKEMTKIPSEKDFSDLTWQQVDRHTTYVVVTGWSQWAKTLYQWIATSLKHNPETFKDIVFFIVGGVLNNDVSHYFEELENCISLPFLNQSDMSTLYYFSDIAITRGWSTSLAEQKLHNMLLCIVPLPRTHDQKKNAEYFVANYGDILVLQNDQLSSSLDKAFSVLSGHKKAHPRHDQLKDQLSKTKKIIADEIISQE